jgi:hypothetical protein
MNKVVEMGSRLQQLALGGGEAHLHTLQRIALKGKDE